MIPEQCRQQHGHERREGVAALGGEGAEGGAEGGDDRGAKVCELSREGLAERLVSGQSRLISRRCASNAERGLPSNRARGLGRRWVGQERGRQASRPVAQARMAGRGGWERGWEGCPLSTFRFASREPAAAPSVSKRGKLLMAATYDERGRVVDAPQEAAARLPSSPPPASPTACPRPRRRASRRPTPPSQRPPPPTRAARPSQTSASRRRRETPRLRLLRLCSSTFWAPWPTGALRSSFVQPTGDAATCAASGGASGRAPPLPPPAPAATRRVQPPAPASAPAWSRRTGPRRPSRNRAPATHLRGSGAASGAAKSAAAPPRHRCRAAPTPRRRRPPAAAAATASPPSALAPPPPPPSAPPPPPAPPARLQTRRVL